MTLRRAFVAALLLLGLVAGVQDVAAQERWPTAFLPPEHWSARSARSLALLGLAPEGYDFVRGAPTQREVGRLFAHAAAMTDSSDAVGEFARTQLAAFRSEFGVAAGAEAWFQGSSIGAGYELRDGALRPGWGWEDGHVYGDWNDAEPLSDESDALIDGTLQLNASDRAALRVAASEGGAGDLLNEAHLAGRLGSVVGWVGRRRLDWAAGPGDGLVINDAQFDGVGLQSAESFRLPGFLRHVGALQAELVVARVDLQRTCFDPHISDDGPPCHDAWFAATRGSVAPHRRVHLGVTRGVVFGGDGNSEVDAFGLFSILIGKHAGEVSELDNQVVAVDASWRLPTERWLPLHAYVEWGFEDSAGAWKNVPGILAGIEVPALPSWPGVRFGVERTSFAPACCGNPMWYRHSVFHDGWVLDDRPLGHRLGGHGVEWALHAGWDAPRHRAGITGQVFTRERSFENLYAETRTGRSTGFELRADARLAGWLDAVARASVEEGDDWRETRASIGLNAFLAGP